MLYKAHRRRSTSNRTMKMNSTSAPRVAPAATNSIEKPVGIVAQNAPLPPLPVDAHPPPGLEPRPPAIQAAKTVIQHERIAEIPTVNVINKENKKGVYKAEPVQSKEQEGNNEVLPILGASPPMSVNYQTGEVKNKQSGIRTFLQSSGRLAVEDSDLTEGESTRRRDSLSCPNGLQELRYADGRSVMCLPGKNQVGVECE
ncbi:unnamed protein product [Strongylus vulgaris]|uniref:Uncharacterized protein n=1 Tax=Strongylus vulgaris TaxID=40348 RepID=A0A3P7J4X7_STRVU|nr:unnamed protein product [Strongylus vulgaris]